MWGKRCVHTIKDAPRGRMDRAKAGGQVRWVAGRDWPWGGWTETKWAVRRAAGSGRTLDCPLGHQFLCGWVPSFLPSFMWATSLSFIHSFISSLYDDFCVVVGRSLRAERERERGRESVTKSEPCPLSTLLLSQPSSPAPLMEQGHLLLCLPPRHPYTMKKAKARK